MWSMFTRGNERERAEYSNLAINYYNQFRNLAMTSFTYTNLPDKLERDTFENGMLQNMLFTADNVTAHPYVIPVSYEGALTRNNKRMFANRIETPNEYDPLVKKMGRFSLGTDWYQYYPETTLGVEMYDNLTRTSLLDDLLAYSVVLTSYDFIIRQHTNKLRVPVMAYTNYAGKKSMQAVIEEMKTNDSGFQIIDMKVKELANQDPTKGLFSETNDIRFFGNDIYALKEKYLQEAYALLGYADPEKRERLVVDEAAMVRETKNAFINSRLMARQDIIGKINDWFGYDIEVRFNNEHGVDTELVDGEGEDTNGQMDNDNERSF